MNSGMKVNVYLATRTHWGTLTHASQLLVTHVHIWAALTDVQSEVRTDIWQVSKAILISSIFLPPFASMGNLVGAPSDKHVNVRDLGITRESLAFVSHPRAKPFPEEDCNCDSYSA